MILIPILLILGAYLVFSLFLFFFPTVLHKPIRHYHSIFYKALYNGKVLRICHRGGPRNGTENTIETFKKNKVYSDMIELDVCETKDGIMVVHHDQDLERTCGIKKHISQLNYAQLPPFKAKIKLDFASEGQCSQTKGEKIPTLEEVFIEFPEVAMNIEIKEPTLNGIKKTVELIKTYKRQKMTILGVRNQLQQYLKAESINGYTFMNDKAFYNLLLTYFLGLLPYVYIEEATMQVPLYTEEYYQWKLKQNNHWKTHLFFRAMRIMNFVIRPMVYHLRLRGIMTYYWVCNKEKDINRAILYGACGIITDDPPLLHSVLKHRNKDEVEQIPVQVPPTQTQKMTDKQTKEKKDD